MDKDTSLDTLLNDEPIEAPAAVESAPEPVIEGEATGQPRDDQGRFALKGEDEGAPPAPVSDEPKLDHAAIVAERRRRQEAEERARTLEAQIQSLQNPPTPPPSMWEDEQGWQQHFGTEVVSTAVQQATMNAKLDMSEMMVRQANPDFEDMKAKFIEMMSQNPSLQQQALSDPHPWDKAYKIAKNAAKIEALGATDVTELEAKLREQIMAEMQAQTPARTGLPPTLTTERSVGQRTGPAWSGPSTLDDLLR